MHVTAIAFLVARTTYCPALPLPNITQQKNYTPSHEFDTYLQHFRIAAATTFFSC
ncbi:hypothetical protein BR93DRAFT_927887 [Coniochaeta sp. PMI_546]|nr:hypothetical protein BR93DRAFT_927887 [Coniochaeta sp. PMI_546]